MALFRRLFYRKPPDRLIEISERVYVFDCCFSTENLEGDEYKVYMDRILKQLQDYFPDASFMVFNFGEGEKRSQTLDILSTYGMTVMDYPLQYEGSPLLPLEMIHHFLKSSESWLSLERQQNILLMNCERGGWPVLAFMLAGLLLYQKQYNGEQKTLEMVYKQAPREFFHVLSTLNAQPSQMRYLQYITRRNLSVDWPPSGKPLLLDCLIMRVIPLYEGGKCCRPVVRVYGQDPSRSTNRSSKLLFTSSKMKKKVRHYELADSLMVKIDIRCQVQGDVVIECIYMDEDLVQESKIFRIVFHTVFVQANILLLSRDDIDVLCDAKDQIPKDFKAEILFMDDDAVVPNSTKSISTEDGHVRANTSTEEFFEVEKIFTSVGNTQKGKAEIDSALQVVVPSNNEKDHREVWKKNADPHASPIYAFDSRNLEQDLKIDPNIDAVKDIVVDDVQYRNYVEYEQVKDILIDDGNIKFNRVATENVPIGNVNDVQGKHEDIEKGHSVEIVPTSKNIDSETLQEKFVSGSQKPENTVASTSEKWTSISSIENADFVTKQRSGYMLQESHTTNMMPWWIPQNRGSPTSSMHILCPPSRYISSPLALALTSTKELNLVDKFKSSSATSIALEAATLAYSPVKPIKEDSTKMASSVKQDSIASTSPQSSYNLQKNVAPTMSSAPPSTLKPMAPPPQPPSPLPQPNNILSLAHTVSSVGDISLSLPMPVPPPPPPPPPPLPASVRQTSGMTFSHPSSPQPRKLVSSSATDSMLSLPPLPPHSCISLITAKVALAPSPSLSPSKGISPQPLPSPAFGAAPVSPLSPLRVPNQLSRAPPPPPPLPTCGTLSTPSPPPLPPLPPKVASSCPLSITCTDLLPSLPLLTGRGPSPEPLLCKRGDTPLHPSIGAPYPLLPSSRAPSPPPLPSRGSPSLSFSSGGALLSPPPAEILYGGSHPPPLVGDAGPPPPPSGTRIIGHLASSPPPLYARKREELTQPGMGTSNIAPKRSSLKPLHWSKVTRALQGSLWDELQRCGENQVSEFDVSELETLFSANVPNTTNGCKGGWRRKSVGSKSDKVQLIDLRRANNTEIMLTKVKMPFPDLMAAVLAMDDTVLNVDQVENLIKFCPSKEEMELLKNYTGDEENLGKCEKYFLELMKVPRVESKLRVFSFKIQFGTQVSEFRKTLNIVNSSSEQVRSSYKLKEIMKRILFLGNVLNQGTARGSAIGFKMDSLLKLADTRATNNKMTLMHFLCKKLADCSPELLDFYQDLSSLEAASKIQLKSLAEEMQAILKGLEKVKQELVVSDSDGPISEVFRKSLKGFLEVAEAEVTSLSSLYQVVGRNADALALYLNEDPARCPFEQVTATLLNFVKLFRKSHEENCIQTELEKRKSEKWRR